MLTLHNYPTKYFSHTYQQIVTSFYNNAKMQGQTAVRPYLSLKARRS